MGKQRHRQHAQGAEGVCRQELRRVGFKLPRGVPFGRCRGHPVDRTPPGGTTGGCANASAQSGLSGVGGDTFSEGLCTDEVSNLSGDPHSLPQSRRVRDKGRAGKVTRGRRERQGSHRSVQTRLQPEPPQDTEEKASGSERSFPRASRRCVFDSDPRRLLLSPRNCRFAAVPGPLPSPSISWRPLAATGWQAATLGGPLGENPASAPFSWAQPWDACIMETASRNPAA